jgi:hypothetical protein
MKDSNWIHVPEEGGDAKAWSGRIWSHGDRMRRWQFEVIRSAPVGGLSKQGVFENARPVTVLLDFQTPGTLIRPTVSRVDPGKVGRRHPFLRTRLEGSFQALLSGRAVEDEQAPLFSGMGFSSLAFRSWHGSQRLSEVVDDQGRTTSIGAEPPETETFDLPGVGTIEAVKQTYPRRDHESSAFRVHNVFRLTFEQDRSLNETMTICLGLELLFGFLAGFRPEPSGFQLWSPEADGRDAELSLGGIAFRQDAPPHPLNRLHGCGWAGIGLPQVLEAFFKAPADIVDRIYAVQLGRWFGGTLNDRFAAAMPVFEAYLKAHFKKGEEQSYIAHRDAFFAYVEDSNDPEITEFARKHLTVQKKKDPSLPTLIGRAIDLLNSDGFAFEPSLAKKIAARRVALFHAPLKGDDDDMQAFNLETLAVTFMLMLLTLRDLGIEPHLLAKSYHALVDFEPFLVWPDPKLLPTA